jgi:SAM-dependent methyltransferase
VQKLSFWFFLYAGMAYLSQVEAILDGSLKGSALPTKQQIRFDDGASDERMMGAWSRLAGDVFLDWLKPGSGLRWVDVGCGNGAFSELVVQRFAPAVLRGVDPSEAQLNYARTRSGARTADFQLGDAMALPFSNDSFDVAVMALVIFSFLIQPKASPRWSG